VARDAGVFHRAPEARRVELINPEKLFTAKDAKDAKENKVQALSSRSPIG
jgi:hypothetical protein